jgi:putative phage-type endonuclease
MRELIAAQQTDQWRDHRLGRETASRMNDLTDYTQKGVEGAKRKKYRFELLAERTTHIEQDNRPPTPAMQWGIDQEQFALQMYEKACDTFIIPVGFVLHPKLNHAGASPDGLTDDAILEVKCPESSTYLRWKLEEDGVPKEHQKQMQWQMACTGRNRGIFIAYDPRQPESNRIFFRDLMRDDTVIAALEAECIKMDGEIEAMIAALGLPPTEWLIEDGELALPSKYAKKSKFAQELEASVLASEAAERESAGAFIDSLEMAP